MTLMLVAALVLNQSPPPLVEPGSRQPLAPIPGVTPPETPEWMLTEQRPAASRVVRAPRVRSASLCLACFPTGGVALAAGFLMSVVPSVSSVARNPRASELTPIAAVLGAIPFVGPIIGLSTPGHDAKATTLFALSLVSEVSGTVLMILGAARKSPVTPAVMPLADGAAASVYGVW